jgi:hypothetical protein
MPPDQQNRTCLFMLLQFTMHSGAKVQPLSSTRLRKRRLVALILSRTYAHSLGHIGGNVMSPSPIDGVGG